MNKIIFITGGARSGKSSFSEELALFLSEKNTNKKIAYLATAEVFDKEMKERVAHHKARRGELFLTYEESIAVDKVIDAIYNDHNIFLFECFSTWLGNIYHKKNKEPEKYTMKILSNIFLKFNGNISIKKTNSVYEKLLFSENKKFDIKLTDIIRKKSDDKFLIIVSNEVNMGIIPESKLSRDYRDHLGRLNQFTADNADFVFFLLSGNPVRIK